MGEQCHSFDRIVYSSITLIFITVTLTLTVDNDIPDHVEIRGRVDVARAARGTLHFMAAATL